MEKNEKIIEIKNKGEASYSMTRISNVYIFSGNIENKSNNKVITSFEIVVRHDDNKDENGKIKEEILKEEIWKERNNWTYPWIQPGNKYEFRFDSLKFKPERISREDKELLFSWHIRNIRGLDIDLR